MNGDITLEIAGGTFYPTGIAYSGKLSSSYQIIIKFEGNTYYNSEELATLENSINEKAVVNIKLDEGERYLFGILKVFTPHFEYKKSDRKKYISGCTIILEPDFVSDESGQYKKYIQKTGADIIKDKLQPFATTTSVELKTDRQLEKREFTLQCESDADFIHRIAAEEGMFYYYKHDSSKVSITFCDSSTGYNDKKINDLNFENKYTQNVFSQTGIFTCVDHDNKSPDVKLEASVKNDAVTANKNVAWNGWQYPGAFNTAAAGNQTMQFKKEAEGCKKNNIIFYSNNIEGIKCDVGDKISVYDTDYLVKEIYFAIEWQTDKALYNYKTTVTVLDVKIPYRAQIPHPPRVHSMPAIVVGSENTERQSENGCVDVKFYFEDSNETGYEPCPLRVVQQFAGKKYGTVFLPPIGTEVYVDFLYGINHTPVIMGCLHDGTNTFPIFDKFESGFLTTLDGTKMNKFSFKDSKDMPEILLSTDGNYTNSVTENFTGTVENGNYSLDIKKGNRSSKIKEADTTEAKELSIKAEDSIDLSGKTIKLEASSTITLAVGSNKIEISTSGITISGAVISAKGDSKLEVESGGIADIKGLTLNLSGSAMTTLKGALVQIN
jgi:type VI secretion system secreted protein VgrG